MATQHDTGRNVPTEIRDAIDRLETLTVLLGQANRGLDNIDAPRLGRMMNESVCAVRNYLLDGDGGDEGQCRAD